jgi:tetratricopeptide (TPR) repeat protein
MATLVRQAEDATAAEPMHQLGQACLRRRELAGAIAWHMRAVAASDDTRYRVALGAALSQAGRVVEAEAAFEHVLTREPDHLDAARHLAWLRLRHRPRISASVTLLARVIAHDPSQLDDYIGLCLSWLLAADRDVAPSVGELTRLLPGARKEHVVRGLAIASMNVGRYDEALNLLQTISSAEAPPDAIADLARAELAVMGAEAARERCQQGLRLHPESGTLVASLLQCLFRLDDIAAARAIYRHPDHLRALYGGRAPAPLDRTSVRGKTLLLRDVGGYGDMIQWVRFAAILAREDCRVIVECLPALAPLLRAAPGVAEVVTPFNPVPACDLQYRADVPALAFDWTDEDMRHGLPYLSRPRAARGCTAPIDEDRSYRIGVCWRAGYNRDTEHDPYSFRSVDADRLAPLMAIPGVTCFSLCYPASDAPAGMIPVSAMFEDFSDTAAAIDAVDLVVTVDTSVAHLAGAMNKPTLLMLSRIPCWRWGSHATASVWYPSVRLFRQPGPGEWGAVIASVTEEVRRRALAHAIDRRIP